MHPLDLLTAQRSGHWPQLEKETLEAHPFCAASGGEIHLQVHHIKPFHIHPDLELEPKNLIVLAAGPTANFHFWLGHLGNWHSFNPHVIEQAAHFLKQVKHRAA
jgi:5-methylcytosine-specific restriction enzyme A